MATKTDWGNRCANPFRRNDLCTGRSLRRVTVNQRSEFPQLTRNARICYVCRKEFSKVFLQKPSNETSMEENAIRVEEDLCDDEADNDIAGKESIKDDPDFLLVKEECKDYENCKDCKDPNHAAGLEVLQQIRDKFKETTDADEKMLLLSLAPKTWSRRKLMDEFGATERQVRKAQKLVEQNGILSLPNRKLGRRLASEIEVAVTNFYEDDENSRLMPGKKDFVSIKKADGTREHVQKRLILGNLSELFDRFKVENENTEIGFSKFAQLRPRHCVLAGGSGTHTVCVCIYHENVHLMLDAIDIKHLTVDSSIELTDYHDCLKVIMCSNPTPACHFSECENCPGIKVLKEHLTAMLDENCVNELRYQVWQQTDRSNLMTEVAETDIFLERLCEKLLNLKSHEFYAKQQASFLKNLKATLLVEHFLIMFDFPENYAYVLQNAIQSSHWNNDQASIFTVVIYYKEKNELKHVSIAIISDNLHHDTVAVHLYQRLIVDYLKKRFNPKKLHYVTDGAPQHFKNKYNFANLLCHEKDFGIPADWTFHPTAHGKGPCDGIGGNLKRLAARASLQRSAENQILTANELFEWASENLKETVVFFSSKEEHAAMSIKLADRFSKAVTIPGTLKYHSFAPNAKGQLDLKRFSYEEKSEVFPKPKRNQKQNSTPRKLKAGTKKRRTA